MYLFLLESIGTSELILIGIVALIFLGPRRLPQIARTVGKTMADLRNTTNEFKATWEREVDFEEEARALRTGELEDEPPKTVARVESITASAEPAEALAPAIRPADKSRFVNLPAGDKADDAEEPDELSDKRNWL